MINKPDSPEATQLHSLVSQIFEKDLYVETISFEEFFTRTRQTLVDLSSFLNTDFFLGKIQTKYCSKNKFLFWIFPPLADREFRRNLHYLLVVQFPPKSKMSDLFFERC
jgi:hypothetical protein